MKKTNTKGYLILCILLILLSIIAFAVPTLKTVTFWIAYVFTIAAFVAQIVIWKIALGRGETLKSKFLGFPVVHIGIVYLIIQTITFVIFMFAPTLPTWIAVVTCSIVCGISAVCMISGEAGRCEIERIESKVQKKVFFIKELQAEINIIASEETNDEIKDTLLQLAEKIRFSDPMSNEQLADLENKISERVVSLKGTTEKAVLIAEITSLLNERNQKCKILK